MVLFDQVESEVAAFHMDDITIATSINKRRIRLLSITIEQVPFVQLNDVLLSSEEVLPNRVDDLFNGQI